MTLAESIQTLVAQVAKIGGETGGLLQRIVDLEDEVSRLRKLVVPIRWTAFTPSFTNGTPASVNVATYLQNSQNLTVTYSVVGTLPSGCTFAGSTLSYNGSGAASSASVVFRAVSGAYTVDTASTVVTVNAAPPVGNRAPVWTTVPTQTATQGTAYSAGLSGYASDPDGNPLTFGRTGSANDTAPASITVGSSGTLTVPSNVAAGTYQVEVFADDGYNDGNWLARSTAPGVVVAYDFSVPPAKGGDWKWGSLAPGPALSPTAKVTCQAVSRAYDSRRYVDTTVYPPGSTASMLFIVPSLSGEAGDQWRISIDDYANQFGAGDEFWVQWRTRMNSVMATHHFYDWNPYTGVVGSPGGTGFKQCFFGAGMQYPYSHTTPTYNQGNTAYYGYQGPGTDTGNQLETQYTPTDSNGEIVMRDRAIQAPNTDAKYPYMYFSKFFDNDATFGANDNYTTHCNEGNEGYHVAACQYSGDPVNVYTDQSTCFQFPTDQWFTQMIHVQVGSTYGTDPTGGSLASSSRTGYLNSTIEHYGQLTPGQPFRLLHRRTGVVLHNPDPGSQGNEKYGLFGWTTFMTSKWPGEVHGEGHLWVSQIIIQRGSTPPAAPSA